VSWILATCLIGAGEKVAQQKNASGYRMKVEVLFDREPKMQAIKSFSAPAMFGIVSLPRLDSLDPSLVKLVECECESGPVETGPPDRRKKRVGRCLAHGRSPCRLPARNGASELMRLINYQKKTWHACMRLINYQRINALNYERLLFNFGTSVKPVNGLRNLFSFFFFTCTCHESIN
jgi:hypothetical protein